MNDGFRDDDSYEKYKYDNCDIVRFNFLMNIRVSYE